MSGGEAGGLVQALHGSPELQFIANSIPGPVSYLDPSLRYRFVNDVYETLLPRIGANVGRDDIIGKSIEEVYGAELASVVRPNLERALNGETFTVEVMFGDAHSLNSYIPHVVGGEVRGVLLVSHDISDLHASRTALIQTDRMASVGRLVAALLHEINSPLGVIGSTMATLERALDRSEQSPPTPKRLAAMLDATRAAREAVERISGITQQLKSFSSLDQADLQTTELREGLETTVALFRSTLPKGVRLSEDYQATPAVCCRPGQINQIFMALLTNARQAIADDGHITVRAYRDGSNACVEVTDDGVGIDKKQQARIFEPAFSNTARRTKAGLGLFVSRSIAEKHGGLLRVKSELGQGACFTLSLPIPEAD